MPSYRERERRRARSGQKPTRLAGRTTDGEAVTGHAVLFRMRPAIELGRMPESGGYPVGFVQAAAQLMGTELADIVHLCSGSVSGGRLTIDIRPAAQPDVLADVRWLPLGRSTVDAILVDPPYDPTYAEQLWGTGKVYPTPTSILRECAEVLRPGGRVGLLHHIVPTQVDGLNRLGTWGVTTGLGYRIRAFTILERPPQSPTLFATHQDLGAQGA